jgi:hypothetical protein
LKRRIEASSGAWTSVSLFERGADQLEDFADGSFDTVIINSVTMYFPSVEYLTRVLVGALRITRPNGAIFVGDVRSMPLLTTFAVSVELFQASPGLSLDELRARVRKRLRLENELFISPLYFLALRELHPQISRIDVLPKRGAHDNEMNCFRYDAVLRVASRVTDYIEPIWLDWARDSMCLATIDRLLRRQASDTLAITGIPNSRVEKDTLAGALLSEQNASDVGTLKQALEVAPKRGIHPEYLFSLADQLGYRMDFSWARAHATGSYDAVFRRRDPCDRESRLPVKWPQATFASNALSRYVVGPVQKIRNRKLVHDLRAALVARFGEHLAPTEFLIVDAIPTVTAGNADHSALPPPWLSCL